MQRCGPVSLWAVLLPPSDKELKCFKVLPKRWGKGKKKRDMNREVRRTKRNADKSRGGVSLGSQEGEKTPWEQEAQMHTIPGVAMHTGKDANVPTVTLLTRVSILSVHGSKA